MKLSEVYTSVQGEGPNTGKMIQFVRFGGCNMRCPGWPCDTQFAIDPIFKDEWISHSPEEVIDKVAGWPRRVCLTGGEPLIQPSTQMETLGWQLTRRGYNVDLFTNGSRILPGWYDFPLVTVVMDWKLPGSGEESTGLDNRIRNAFLLRGKQHAIKFVVTNEEDLIYALEAYQEHLIGNRIFVGAAWGHITDQEIISFLERHELDWELNVQVHKHIWPPDLRGV